MTWERGWLLVFIAACSSPPDLESGTARRDRVLAEEEAAASGSAATARGATRKGGGTSAGGACIEGVASPGSGGHHPGDDCMGCHASSTSKWTIAGTLLVGGKAASGATIEVVDCTGKKLSLTTYDNGNFYTKEAVGFPLKVRASKCPTDAVMGSPASNGSCNASGCHARGVQAQ